MRADILFAVLVLGAVVTKPASAQFPFQDRDRPEMARPQPVITNETPTEAVPADEPVVRFPAPRARPKSVAIPLPRPAPSRAAAAATYPPIGVPETVGNDRDFSPSRTEPGVVHSTGEKAATSPAAAPMHVPLLSQ
jgi:hypothetical protein